MIRASAVMLCALAVPSALHGQHPEVFPSAAVNAWTLGVRDYGASPGTEPGSGRFLPLFLTAGNPAALTRGVTGRSALINLSNTLESGTYRRPLDPGRVRHTQVGARGQAAFSSNAVIGRAEVTQGRTRAGNASVLSTPYGFAPYDVADTASADIQFSDMVAEGSAAVAVGRLVLGAGARVSAQIRNTLSAPVPRNARAVHPAAAAGVEFSFTPAVRVSAHVVHEFWTETAQTRAVAAGTRIFEFNGLLEVEPRDLNTFHQRQRKGGGTLAGAGLNGDWKDVAWMLNYAREAPAEVHRASEFGDALFEWEMERHTLIGGVGSAVPALPVETQVTAAYHADSECGTRTETDIDCSLRGSRNTIDVQWGSHVRVRPTTEAEVMVAFTRSEYDLTDDLVPAHHRSIDVTTRIATTVHHAVTRGLGVLATAGYSARGAAGQIPRSAIGTSFQVYTAPPLLMAATDSRAQEVGIGISLRRDEQLYLLRVTGHRLTPKLDGVHIAARPEGTRQMLSAELSVIF